MALFGFCVLFVLALVTPEPLLTLAARIDATEARGFAIAFALQTKSDVAQARDLGWRSALIALAEQAARVQGYGFDELANLRLAATLLHTDFELRTPDGMQIGSTDGRSPIQECAHGQSLHPLVGRTVCVPSDTFGLLREAASDDPQTRAARLLKVTDIFIGSVNLWDPREERSACTASALAAVEQQFAAWEEVDALRRVLSHRDQA
ncbi:MAG: hypothetical protein OXG33_04385 [Chloroflexi bacterium]|nr:hypothetical protein [Chloroflexota bacterium]